MGRLGDDADDTLTPPPAKATKRHLELCGAPIPQYLQAREELVLEFLWKRCGGNGKMWAWLDIDEVFQQFETRPKPGLPDLDKPYVPCLNVKASVEELARRGEIELKD